MKKETVEDAVQIVEAEIAAWNSGVFDNDPIQAMWQRRDLFLSAAKECAKLRAENARLVAEYQLLVLP